MGRILLVMIMGAALFLSGAWYLGMLEGIVDNPAVKHPTSQEKKVHLLAEGAGAQVVLLAGRHRKHADMAHIVNQRAARADAQPHGV